MIEIKSLFSEWHEVDVEKAISYVNTIKKGMINIKENEKNEYINKKRLRGTTVEELLNDI